MERYCDNCREAFYPIEGNETRDFCSDLCEEAYGEELYSAWDTASENANAYDLAYGRHCSKG